MCIIQRSNCQGADDDEERARERERGRERERAGTISPPRTIVFARASARCVQCRSDVYQPYMRQYGRLARLRRWQIACGEEDGPRLVRPGLGYIYAERRNQASFVRPGEFAAIYPCLTTRRPSSQDLQQQQQQPQRRTHIYTAHLCTHYNAHAVQSYSGFGTRSYSRAEGAPLPLPRPRERKACVERGRGG